MSGAVRRLSASRRVTTIPPKRFSRIFGNS
jgi:hypothetical protein